MTDERRHIQVSRVVVVMPNWLGDGVMATPFLRALRGLYKDGRMVAVARPLVAAVCEGLVDEVKVYGKGEEGRVSRWMRGERFELGVLLPNSFRSAWMMWRGGVGRRVGYARENRGWLLTDRVEAIRRTAERRAVDAGREQAIRGLGGGAVRIGSAYEPVAAIEYYLGLASYLREGRKHEDAKNTKTHEENTEFNIRKDERRMELWVSEEERREGEGALRELGVKGEGDSDSRSQISELKDQVSNYVVVVPGANFGASKCWEPARYAEVARRLVGEFGMKVVLVGSVGELQILEAILRVVGAVVGVQRDVQKGAVVRPAPPQAAGVGSESSVAVKGGVVSILEANGGKGVSVGALKEMVRGARLMVCNDTGPRHMAVAFGVPVVTLFGPTDPVWAETFYEKERIVRVEVPCGPCQLKVCPIDHRCMKGITVEMVMGAVREVWGIGEKVK